ncbi:MAG: methyltransferase domain-containing protein [Pseudomonadota bacterium]
MTKGAVQLEVTQLAYAAERARIAKLLEGPVLHIGARSQVIDQKVEGRFTWRGALSGQKVVGADLEEGDNVDLVMDITWPLERVNAALGEDQTFGAVICAHLLEHVRDPFVAARNVAALLRPGGLAFIQVPWVQGFHDFPDDFWRISFSGLQVLFPDFQTEDMFYSGGSSDVCYRLHRGGVPAVDVEALKLEPQLFQVLLPQPANQNMLKQLGKTAYLSRGYMPATVLTWLARKPA